MEVRLQCLCVSADLKLCSRKARFRSRAQSERWQTDMLDFRLAPQLLASRFRPRVIQLRAMADSPAPVSTPASAGFKLKLKLGGNSIGQHARTASLASGNDGSNATPSTSTSASTSVPASTAPASAVAAAPPAQPADVSMDIETEGDAEPDLLDADPDADADDLYMDQTSQPDDADDGDFTVGTSKKSKAKAKAGGSSTPTFTYSSAPLEGQGGTVMPTGHYDSTGQLGTSLQVPPPAKKRKAPTANPGAGRGWRKGLKNSEKQEGVSLSLTGKAASGTPPPSTASAPLPGKRRKAAVNMAEDGAAEDDQDEDFVPMMVAPGGLATSDKWQNGLPGGNEQSRQTAAMAAAVNKLFPVGPPPKVSILRSIHLA